jgi:hypothetical protein
LHADANNALDLQDMVLEKSEIRMILETSQVINAPEILCSYRFMVEQCQSNRLKQRTIRPTSLRILSAFHPEA